jgi:hypothetical protein
MSEVLFAKLVCFDAFGAEIAVTGDKPKGCPGQGGWKSRGNASWWTRVKGPKACEIDNVAHRNDGFAVITIDGDKIVAIGT